MSDRLRIAIIASVRHPIAEPFAGGLEAHTWALTRGLRERGHSVSLFAAPGSDPALGCTTLPVRWPEFSPTALSDPSALAVEFMQQHHAYLDVMLELAHHGRSRFDVIHNNSLHYLPVAMAAATDLPVLTTVHTPPTPWLESAAGLARPSPHCVAVSEFTAAQWHHVVASMPVIRNGIDLRRWQPGPGGRTAVWAGRICPEKGTHLAIVAARTAGFELDIIGPISDRAYFWAEVAPLLDGAVRHLGHVAAARLAEHMGRAAVCVLTPCWDEPFGLVAAEALACGTPVAAFDSGGVGEVVPPDAGVLVAPDDVEALASAMRTASRLPRDTVRHVAETTLSEETMISQYISHYKMYATGGAA